MLQLCVVSWQSRRVLALEAFFMSWVHSTVHLTDSPDAGDRCGSKVSGAARGGVGTDIVVCNRCRGMLLMA